MWRYIGGSLTVYCNIELAKLIFPGLYVGFNNGTSTNYYMIVNVYPHYSYTQGGSLPYFIVAPTYGSRTGLAGTSGTTYTGTVIHQQPYVLSVI